MNRSENNLTVDNIPSTEKKDVEVTEAEPKRKLKVIVRSSIRAGKFDRWN